MSKTRMGKRVASLLLSLVMMLSLLPTTVYATEDTGGGTGATYDAVQQTESGDNTENTGKLESTGEGEDDSEAGNEGETSVTYVAQVGDVQYKTLEEAIGVAADGATVSLLDNVTLNTTLTVAKSITIDVGGFTLTVATDGDGIVVNNATLTLTGTGKYVFNCTASGSDGIFVNNTVEGGTSELNLNGNVDINVSGNVSSAIHAYASAGKAVVNINAGTITARGSKQFPGVVVDQNATLNMTGGTFDLSMDFDAYSDGNDVVGVLIWGGSSHKQENCAVNISGGTFKVGGKNAFAQAVQVGMSNGYSENCTVNISGGNVVLNPTEGGKGYVYTAYKASYATAAITGGTVSGKVTAIANTYIRDLENDGLTISGGTFSGITVDEKYLADGKTLDASGNVVDKAPEVKPVTVNGVGYDTLAAAIAAAESGATVKLLADVNENVEIAAGKNLTLDLNGCTLNGGTGTNKAALTNYGTITITDSSEAKTGTIKRNDIGTVGETSYYVILNQGTMTIESGTVINNSGYKKANSTGSMVGSSLICNGDCNGGSTLTINGGTFTQYNFIAIKNGALGVLNVTGGMITSNHSAIQNWFEADITGGEINGQLWTDAYTAGGSNGKTKIGGNATFTGEIVMDIYGNSVAPKLEITGGKLNVTNWRITGAAAAVGAKPAVSGGTFTAEVPADYLADGFEIKQNSDGSYGVEKAASYVAKIDEQSYATLQAAFDAANAGQTITLLDDVNLTSAQAISKQLTIDLNGKTISSTAYQTITVNSGADLTVTDSAGGGKIANEYKGSSNPATIYLNAAGTKFTLESGTIESDPNKTSLQSVAINSENSKACEVNIKGGSVTVPKAATKGRAIVASTNSMTLNISGGTIAGGLHGVDAYSGSTVNITGGTITARVEDTGEIKEAYGMRLIGTANVTVAGGTITGVKMDDNGYKPDVPNVTLKSGTINGSFYYISKGTITFTVAENADIVLANDSAAKFLPDTVKLVQNADGTYGIKAGTYVAQVGSTKYETLQEAINATVTGDTVTLLADVDLGSSVSFYNKKDTSVCNLTFDLNGHTITSAIGDNGTVLAAREGLVIKNGAIVNTSESTNKKTSAICVTSKGTTTIENVTVTSKVSGVYICQLTSTGAEVVNVESGTFISGEYGVYIANPKGSTTKSPVETLNINGGTINGTHTGVYAKGAESGSRNAVVNVNITAGTVSSVGVYGAKEEQPVNLTVSGGTISDKLHIDNLGGKALVTGGAVKGAVTNNGTLTISGGTFNGDLTNKTNGSITITGGTFATKPNETYLADGYVFATNGDGTYGVTAGTVYVAAIGENKYTSLQAAIEAATRNATVKLLADTRENVTISTPYLTLDLNGFTLNGSTGERKPALTVTARVTVKDSSENQTGTIMREDTAENSGVSSHYVIDVQGDGWLTFESGNVKNNSGIVGVTGASLVRVGDDSVAKYPGLNIKGGTFTQDNFIVIKVDRGDLFLNGGTLNSAHSYAIEDWHRATIKGGTVNGTVAAWTYSGGLNSDLTISGGTINGDVTSVNYGNAEDKVAKVSITGGTITGELDTRSYDPKTGELTSIDDAAKATIKVTGGTFDKDPTKYVVEDSAVNQNADGTFGVAKAYLAKVGKTSYYTMDEARKAQSTSGEDIVLLRDYTTGSPFRSGISARVVDLNGYTWTCTGKDANSAAFEISNHDAMLTVKNGKVVSSQLVGLIPSAMDGTITYDNSSLVFDGVEMSTTAHSGIETNGNNTNDTVTLKNSTLNVPNGFGIYFPSSGTLTIDKSTINAKTMGVQVCAGSLNINAGSGITVTGDEVPKTENDGAIQDGAAISIVNRTGYKGLDKIEVTGGTFTAKTGNDAIKAYDWANNTATDFTANDKVFVSGGTFSSAVKEEYCADGYIPTANGDGTYGVKEGQYVAYVGTSTNKFETLQAAINAAKDSQTVRLLADITLTETAVFPAGKKVSINLQGHKITATGTALRINGTTEINSSKTGAPDAAQTGMIESTNNVAVAVGNNAKLSVFSGTLKGREGAVITGTSTGATIDVRGSKATLIATDNAVIAGNGSKRDGDPNNITIRNGTFIGGIVTEGYIACGIYAPWNDNVTVSGGTFNITDGAGIVARAGTVKVTDGTFNCGNGQTMGWVGDSKNQVPNAALVFDKAANYPALTESSQILVSRGSFSTDPAANGATLADGYVATKDESGMYKVAKADPVAEIDGVKYDTLSQAITALEDKSGTIKLLQDINAPSMNYKITENITIDLNGHNITGSGTEGVFYVYTSGHLTITGDGVITAVEKNKAAIAVQVYSENAKVTLEGGTYKQQITNANDPQFDLIYVYYGTAEITGGTYEGATPAWTLNCRDENYKAGTAHITVTGGTFKGFDPANNTAEGEGTSFVPDGYIPKANGDGSYTVVKGTYVAEYDGTKYETLQKAIDAASQKNGGQAVVTLLGDLTITETVNFANVKASSVLLDLGGHTLTGEGCRALQINKGNLYLENGTVTSTGIINSSSVIRIGSNEDAYSGVSPLLYMRKGAKVLAPDSYGVTIFGSKTVSEKLTVAGNASIVATGDSPAISGNGDKAYHVDGKGTQITITGNAVVSATNNYAIYHPDNGTLKIQNSATVSGKGGIQMCSGTLDISYGSPKIEALGKADHETGAAGPIYDVAAISVVNRSYPGGAPVVTIKGTPTITAVDGEVIHAYTWSSGAESEWAEAGDNINVSGGTYSKDFKEAYLAADCTLVPNGDTTYTVKQEPVAEYNGTQYTSLAQALQDARNADGGEVKLLKDVTQTTYSLDIGKVTLNLNRQTLTLDGGAQLYTSGDATINNGTIKRIDTPTSGNANDFAIQVMSGSSLTLGATSADTVTIESTYGVYNAGGTLTVSHAVITTDGWSIAVNDSKTKTGEVTIGEGAVITSKTGNCIGTRVNSKPNVTITGGQLTSDGTNWGAGVIYWASEGTLTITGGTFTASAEGSTAAAVYQKNGTVKISGSSTKLLGSNALVVQTGEGSTGTMITELSGGTYSTKPEEAWVVNGYRAIENTDGTFTVEEAKYVIKVTSCIEGTDQTVATPTGGGMYCEGEKVTVATNAVAGFKFLGWYDGATLLDTHMTYEHTVTGDCTLIAKYTAVSGGTFRLEVNASKFTVDEKPKMRYVDMRINAATEVVVEYTGNDKFLYWINGSNNVVSTEAKITLVAVGNFKLTAVVESTELGSDYAYVIFKNAFVKGQSLSADYYTSSDTIVFPSTPVYVGRTFKYWGTEVNGEIVEATQAVISDLIKNGATTVIIAPVYESNGTYTVKVNYVDTEGNSLKDTLTISGIGTGLMQYVTADEKIDELTFSHWEIGGKNVGTNKTYAALSRTNGDVVALTAVYVTEGTVTKPENVLTIAATGANIEGGKYKLTFTANYSIDENATIKKGGILFSNKDIAEDIFTINNTSLMCTEWDGDIAQSGARNGVINYSKETTRIYARAYITLADGTVIYSDIVNATYSEIVKK